MAEKLSGDEAIEEKNDEHDDAPPAADGSGESAAAKKRRKRKAAKKTAAPASEATEGDNLTTVASGSTIVEAATSAAAQSKPNLQELTRILAQAKTSDDPKNKAEKQYKFWSTQPVPQFNEPTASGVNEPIDPDKDNVRQEPFSLPSGYVWDTIDITDNNILEEVYQLLLANYVEDDDAMFRFKYSHEFLRWALTPPGWKPFWHVGIRAETSKALLGFIGATPAIIRINGVERNSSEVNFLCVHKKLREKRMAVVLIREVARRCNVNGVFQAVYTAGTRLPRPVATCRYWHRSLNPKKLVEIGFSSLTPTMHSMKLMKRFYQCKEDTKTPRLRPAIKSDVPAMTKLLNEYLRRYRLHAVFTEDEVQHWFIKGVELGVLHAYVAVDAADQAVTDLLSFYSLPSTVVNHPVHDSLHAAYSFYNVATTVSIRDLMNDALTLAKKNNFDVFNALDLMENEPLMTELRFGKGDGELNYYIYNWRCDVMQANENGLILM